MVLFPSAWEAKPEEVVFKPSACELVFDAVVPCPSVWLFVPDAVVLFPSAWEAKPEEVVFKPSACELVFVAFVPCPSVCE